MFTTAGQKAFAHLLERVVDPVDAVLLHGEQEARRHLRLGGPGVEERGGGVGEEPLRHEVVRLDDLVDVPLVDAHRHAHDHVLRPLHHLTVGLEEVRPTEIAASRIKSRQETPHTDKRKDR